MKYTRLLSCLLYFTALKNIFADKYLSEELMGEVYKAQSDLFWRIHQNAALCYLLLFLCNWGV